LLQFFSSHFDVLAQPFIFCSSLTLLFSNFILFLFWLFIGTLVFIASALHQSVPSAAIAESDALKSTLATSWQKVGAIHLFVHFAVQ
jgi:hypothetical protein